MTLQDAIEMMGTTVTISMESDKALADAVTRDQLAKHPNSPHKGAITPAVGVHGNLQLRPISAMLELARGTALSSDPDVASFARRWSTLRHLGLFAKDVRTKNLHLDAKALGYIGANQRRVLSEELGIGFGIMVAKHWCQTRTPTIGPVTAIDVDRALHRPVPRLQLTGSRQPDYLLAYSDPANPGTKIYDLLETKGTVSKLTATRQLSRAVTQLAGLTVNGQQVTGIAASTVSNVDGVLVMAVDPEERRVTWEPTNAALERSRTSPRRTHADNVRLDVSDEELFATATNVEYASLAEFSGQQDAATRWLPNEDPDRRDDANIEVRRETEAGTFVGSEYVIEIPGSTGRLRVYHGVEAEIVDGLRARDVTAVMEAQSAFVRAPTSQTDTSSVRRDGVEPVSAFTSDGSMLELSIV